MTLAGCVDENVPDFQRTRSQANVLDVRMQSSLASEISGCWRVFKLADQINVNV